MERVWIGKLWINLGFDRNRLDLVAESHGDCAMPFYFDRHKTHERKIAIDCSLAGLLRALKLSASGRCVRQYVADKEKHLLLEFVREIRSQCNRLCDDAALELVIANSNHYLRHAKIRSVKTSPHFTSKIIR
jgi:hypothetical protein